MELVYKDERRHGGSVEDNTCMLNNVFKIAQRCETRKYSIEYLWMILEWNCGIIVTRHLSSSVRPGDVAQSSATHERQRYTDVDFM